MFRIANDINAHTHILGRLATAASAQIEWPLSAIRLTINCAIACNAMLPSATCMQGACDGYVSGAANVLIRIMSCFRFAQAHWPAVASE